MTITRTEPITLMASGSYSIYSKIKPLYAASSKTSLQEVLRGCDMTFPISSSLLGETDDGLLITLEEFLIHSNMPLTYIKTITIGFSNDLPSKLKVRTLYVKSDVLYMEVLDGGKECKREGNQLITRPAYSLGLDDYQVSNISSLELEGGLRWKQ